MLGFLISILVYGKKKKGDIFTVEAKNTSRLKNGFW